MLRRSQSDRRAWRLLLGGLPSSRLLLWGIAAVSLSAASPPRRNDTVSSSRAASPGRPQSRRSVQPFPHTHFRACRRGCPDRSYTRKSASDRREDRRFDPSSFRSCLCDQRPSARHRRVTVASRPTPRPFRCDLYFPHCATSSLTRDTSQLVRDLLRPAPSRYSTHSGPLVESTYRTEWPGDFQSERRRASS